MNRRFDPVLVHDCLDRSAERYPDKTACVFGEERRSYGRLQKETCGVARWLMGRGLARGDRVLIFTKTGVRALSAVYGVLRAGCAFVVVGESIKPPKLAYIIDDCEAGAIIAHADKADVVKDALDGTESNPSILWIGSSEEPPAAVGKNASTWESVANSPDDENLAKEFPDIIETDIAALIYTSGSTGEPKGVISTHHNMVSAARSIIQYIGNTEDDVVIDVLPLSFDYGLYQAIMTFMFGGALVLESSFFYIHRVLETVAREKVTGFPLVPSAAAMLCKLQDTGKYDLSGVRYVTSTGSVLTREHIRRIRELMPNARLFSMYGLTECKRVSYLPPEQLSARPTSVGVPMPNCRVRIVDADGDPLPRGETGELVVEGPNVMQGYWGALEATEKTFRRGKYPHDRVLYSGDFFKTDEEGFLYYVGRNDDLIKTQGFRVGPQEVEKVIGDLDGVMETAVIGVPHDVMGQVVKAFVVLKPGVSLKEKDVLRHCSDNLEPFMIPKSIVFLEALPRNEHGKVDKRKLQE